MGYQPRAYLILFVVPTEERIDGYKKLGAGKEYQFRGIIREKICEEELVVKVGLVTAVSERQEIEQKGDHLDRDEVADKNDRAALYDG